VFARENIYSAKFLERVHGRAKRKSRLKNSRML
jgi:hypothetical protein